MRTPEEAAVLMDMVSMRIEGHTFQQIADKYGVSKQCVQQKISSLSSLTGTSKRKQTRLKDKCIYPNLLNWMCEERVTLTKIAEVIGVTTKNTSSIRDKLIGRYPFNISEIKALLNFTGCNFEFLFEEKGGNNNASTVPAPADGA